MFWIEWCVFRLWCNVHSVQSVHLYNVCLRSSQCIAIGHHKCLHQSATIFQVCSSQIMECVCSKRRLALFTFVPAKELQHRTNNCNNFDAMNMQTSIRQFESQILFGLISYQHYQHFITYRNLDLPISIEKLVQIRYRTVHLTVWTQFEKFRKKN